MTSYPKRLIEVDLPIKRISAHARREKSIRHGHISTLHIWWARRPLAACRAVICAVLWPDPVDENCPQLFRDLAAEHITNFAKKAVADQDLSRHCSYDIWQKWQGLAKVENQLEPNNPQHWHRLRASMLDFIADFANWDNSTQPDYLATSRNLTPSFEGTVKRGSGTCPCCGFTTPVASVRKQLKACKGGADDARLFCVVTTKLKQQGRFYRLPREADLEAVKKAGEELERRKTKHQGVLSLVPDEPTPKGGGSGAGRAFSQRNYGMDRFEDLFTSRQALALTTLAKLVKSVGEKLADGEDKGLADAVQTILSIGVSKITDVMCSLVTWQISMDRIGHLFTRQAIPMTWDFAETSPVSSAAGDYSVTMKNVLEVLDRESITAYPVASVEKSSAATHPLPDNFAQCFISDPPYYDAVPYADLSDFFYVWLKRTLPPGASISFTDEITPKDDECIVDEVKGKDKAYFETTMGKAMSEGCRLLSLDGIGVIVFAHKSTSGWEAQLQAMVNAGWTITGSWPIDTEMGTRLRAMNSAVLASSIHLVCRPRNTNTIGDWRDVLQELPQRIHEWMPRLAIEGVVGADAIFACLGPALEIFSRYSSVEKASGELVTLKECSSLWMSGICNG